MKTKKKKKPYTKQNAYMCCGVCQKYDNTTGKCTVIDMEFPENDPKCGDFVADDDKVVEREQNKADKRMNKSSHLDSLKVGKHDPHKNV